jgi:hypothetical protein
MTDFRTKQVTREENRIRNSQWKGEKSEKTGKIQEFGI